MKQEKEINARLHHTIQTILDRLLPEYTRIPLLIVLGVNMATYYLTRIVSTKLPHHVLSSTLDKAIPCIPWTVLIYFGCYIFWVVNYLLCSSIEKRKGLQFLLADLIGKCICAACFLAFPTTLIRPEITAPGIFNNLMRFLYSVDPADNLFPSLHCFISWLCYIGIRLDKRFPLWYRLFSIVFALCVCISTLTTKQHVLVDVFAGIVLAEGSYFLASLLHTDRPSKRAK